MTRNLLLMSSLVLGFLVGFFAGRAFESRESRYQRQVLEEDGWNRIPIVVVNRDVERGREIEVEMLAQYEVPERFLTENVITSDRATEFVGRRLRGSLRRGDFLRESDLEPAEKAPQASPGAP